MQARIKSGPVDDLGRIVEIGPDSVYLECAGTGEPLVIFDAPIGADSAYWRQQRDIVSKYTQACVYDRFGYGHSSDKLNEQNADQLAADIERLLRYAQLPRSFVYVSAGTGLYTAQSLARHFPDRLQGIVITDPVARDDESALWPGEANEDELLQSAKMLKRLAEFSVLQIASPDFLYRFNSQIRPLPDQDYSAQVLLPSFWDSVIRELSALDSSRIRVSDDLLGYLPLSLLWSEPSTECGRIFSEESISSRRLRAEQLASLSSNGVAVAVPGVCRDLALEHPEAVTPEILRAVEKYRDYLNNGH